MDQTILEIKKNIKNMNIINKIINEIQTPKLLLESLEKNIKLFNDIQLLTISKNTDIFVIHNGKINIIFFIN